jgi:hypothetical protein
MSDSIKDGAFRMDGTSAPFENLVALDVRWPGNRLGRRFPLNIVLEVEQFLLTVPVKPSLLHRLASHFPGQSGTSDETLKLRVRLRHCYVRYFSSDIRIVADTKYQCPVTDGHYQSKTTKRSTEQRRSRTGGGLSAKASVRAPERNASLGAHGAIDAARDVTKEQETSVTFQPDLFEVQAVPNGWRIGHPELGDPTKLDGCLDGRYFHRPADGFPQTCEAEFHEGLTSGSIAFLVTLRDGFEVEKINGGPVTNSEKVSAVALMRNKLAAIRIERHLTHGSDDAARADDEIHLASVVCSAVQASDVESATPNLKSNEISQITDEAALPAKRRHTRRSIL